MVRDLVLERTEAGRANERKFRAVIEASNGSDAWTLEDLVVRHGGANGVFGEAGAGGGLGSDILVRRVESYGHLRRGGVAANAAASGQRFEDVHFHGNREDGLLINSSDGTLAHSRLDGNGREPGGQPRHGVYMYPYGSGARRWRIRGNTMSGNRDSGARIAGTDHRVESNRISGSDYGLFLVDLDGPNSGHLIVGNRIEDTAANGWGIEIDGGVDITLRDNVFRRSGGVVLVQARRGGACRNIVLEGNELGVNDDSGFVDVRPGQGEGFTARGNTYRAIGEGRRWRWAGERLDFATWQRRSGQDRHSTFDERP